MNATPDPCETDAGPQPIEDEALGVATGGTAVSLCKNPASCTEQPTTNGVTNVTISWTTTTTVNVTT